MALPSFNSPPFVVGNYSHLGSELVLHVNNGISCVGGTPDSIDKHSAVSQFISVYSTIAYSRFTRTGSLPDSGTGFVTNYVELMLEPGTNYAFPLDFIRLRLEVEKVFAQPVSNMHPLKYRVDVITGQLGIVHSHPVYNVNAIIPPPDIEVRFQVFERENGYADINIQYDDNVNSENFLHIVNNYPFNYSQSALWRYHSRLNIEANPYTTVIESETQLTAQSAILVSSIDSAESFGNTSVAVAPTQDINSPLSIVSRELFGSPTISVGLTYIIVSSIESLEQIGDHRVINTTIINSGVSAPELPKEGDIRLILDPYVGYGEMVLDDRDVERDSGLETSVLITLGTNRISNPDDILPDDKDYGGWWGDFVPVVEGDLEGTRLWLLRRSKTDNELITKSQEYLREGFQWMLDDGVISEFLVDTWKVTSMLNTLGMNLGFRRPSLVTVFYKYYYNWENQSLRSV